MARIESLGEFFRFTNAPGKPTRRKTTKGFRSMLRESLTGLDATELAETEELEAGDLEELLDGVHAAGDALKKRQSESTILAYRRAVQTFAKFVLRRAYETVRHHSRPNALKGTQREYLLVRTVDEKLERLVVDVLRSQVEQIDLLRRIDEIHGLLVDLLT
jgi:uncharacterized protein YaaR (DUF327 family)